MTKQRIVVMIAAAAAGLACPGPLCGATVLDVVNQVSQSQYTQYLSGPDFLYTHNGDSRGFAPQHDLARANIQSTLTSFGLSTGLDAFTYSGATYYNVVAVKAGAVHPENIYIVGAHYDSVGNPGADDNASGVAGVLEAARVLSGYRFESTLIFIAFDREEQGLWGSYAYSTAHENDNILGMVSLDMIAFNPAGSLHDKARIYGRVASDPIKAALAWSMTTYGGGLAPLVGGDVPYSDHAGFEARGKQACLLIEPYEYNPNYHQAADSADTPNYIDYVYATKMERSAVGFLAGSAGLILDGDANGDGLVDQTDYALWFNSYGASGPGVPGDMNYDGWVDATDYALWFNNYGAGGANGVPEPATLTLLAIGAAAIVRRRSEKHEIRNPKSETNSKSE